MEAVAGVPAEAKSKLAFDYDYIGRRIQKRVHVWNVPTSSYQLQSVTKFVYDGWNMVEELDVNNALVRSYVWGTDLGGSLQDTGGIGGLLLVSGGGNTYQAGYDGNGNVVSLIKASTGTVSASYEYDPFGNPLILTGEYAVQNPFRFSTKYVDQETGLLYYSYRYYNPQTGKWLSRDPLEEESGVNLYRFNDNDPISYVDPLGLQIRSDSRDPQQRRPPVFDRNSPNWDLANGALHYTYHNIFIELCCARTRKPSRAEVTRMMYKDLAQFSHFDYPKENIGQALVSGNKVHYTISGTVLPALSYIVGNTIDVELVLHPQKNEVQAVTLGDHPLVGSRKWRVENPRGYVFKVITEAYEQASGLSNWVAHPLAAYQQDDMWTTYLENIGSHWQLLYPGTTVSKVNRLFEDVTLPKNPYRAELPTNLQNSRHIER